MKHTTIIDIAKELGISKSNGIKGIVGRHAQREARDNETYQRNRFPNGIPAQ